MAVSNASLYTTEGNVGRCFDILVQQQRQQTPSSFRSTQILSTTLVFKERIVPRAHGIRTFHDYSVGDCTRLDRV
ncbi:uncharacterized protein [Panulirus ornatus]|uniref:uncharacterized protein isoform X2 n=1 Tax=Panulirus ornatus TaxID=150431 RepID=UPI003A8B1866